MENNLFKWVNYAFFLSVLRILNITFIQGTDTFSTILYRDEWIMRMAPSSEHNEALHVLEPLLTVKISSK